MIPSLRHPMTTAAAIATLVDLAGSERVMVGVGTGFTGRLTLGQRPLKWADVAEYIRAVKALLHGDEVVVDGVPTAMMQWPGFGAPRPIDVPFVIAVGGPKGMAVAEELADGIFSPVPTPGYSWSTVLTFGTVLDAGEDPGPRGDRRGRPRRRGGDARRRRVRPARQPPERAGVARRLRRRARGVAPHRPPRRAPVRRQRPRPPIRDGSAARRVGPRARRRCVAREARHGRGDGCDGRRLPARRPRRPAELEAFITERRCIDRCPASTRCANTRMLRRRGVGFIGSVLRHSPSSVVQRRGDAPAPSARGRSRRRP